MRRTRGRALLACLAALLVLGACGSPGNGAAPSPASPSAGGLGLAAVGDSITAADSADLSAGELGQESWVAHAVGAGVTFVGGWAQWGATTEQMAAGVQAVDADALVILAGTNDVSAGVPFAETAENIAEIATTVGAPRVVLSSVPPLDSAPQLAAELNADLEALAVAREWEFVDAAAGLRQDGRFADGMSPDGVHPSAEGARVLGEAIRAALVTEE